MAARAAWRDCFYVPSSQEYAIPWSVGVSASLLLSAFGLPGAQSLTTPPVSASLGELGLRLVAVGCFDGTILWTHLRPFHLTWATGRRQFWCTFAALGFVFCLAWGLVLLVRNQIAIAPGWRELDIATTVSALTYGLVGFAVALIVPTWWKGEEPGVGNVRSERARALALLRQLLDRSISKSGFFLLVDALQSLDRSADTLMPRLETRRDHELLREWQSAATELSRMLGSNFEGVHQSTDVERWKVVKAERERLRRNG